MCRCEARIIAAISMVACGSPVEFVLTRLRPANRVEQDHSREGLDVITITDPRYKCNGRHKSSQVYIICTCSGTQGPWVSKC